MAAANLQLHLAVSQTVIPALEKELAGADELISLLVQGEDAAVRH